MISPRNLTGEKMSVAGLFQSREVPVAIVPFEIGWEEEVVVGPPEGAGANEVIYGLDLRTGMSRQLIALIEVDKPLSVTRVTTRAEAQKELEQQTKDDLIVAEEGPIVKPSSEHRQASEGNDDGGKILDLELEDDCEVLGIDAEESEGNLGIEKNASVLRDEVVDLGLGESYVLRTECQEEPDIDIPSVGTGSSGRQKLIAEVRSDPTLKRWRELADGEEEGFSWRDKLLCQSKLIHTAERVYVLVLPKSARQRVLEVVHEGLQHMGARRVRELISQRFSWPGLGTDVINHVKSCDICQKNGRVQGKVPMIPRKVLTEPFETMGVDIVGPFPKGRGGNRFLLTGICLASKWPEAVPLTAVTANNVAEGLMKMFSHTGIPLQILSDQGSQFIGKVVAQLCRSLRIDKLKTAPYHPECNGTIERMHGTLKSMLNKAASQKLDWVGQIPFVMFALRAAPNRETGFSPFELCFGRTVRTPLDILHQGWTEVEFEKLDTQEWADWLVERLSVWHSVMQERGDHAVEKRREYFDRGKRVRTLEPGDLVLCRVPGMIPKLKESWHGPYRVLEKLNQVDYKVEMNNRRKKVLHINNLKRYMTREVAVRRLTIVAEDFSEDESVKLKLEGQCAEFDEEELQGLLGQYPDVLTDLPGRTDVTELSIVTGDCLPIASQPYKVPEVLKCEVKKEIYKLVDIGVVVESVSPWASPIVPVPKKDGSLRLCIDYRRLNKVTQGDPYYMSTLDEIIERVGESRCLSKLDLSKGFYQIPVSSESVDKTAFITPFGKFAFKRMPFGLKNAPSIFQRTMEVVLRSCYLFAAPYIDDVVIFSKNGVEHMTHLKEVLEEFRRYGLTVKRDKCLFGKKRLEYLGHLIGDGQLAVPEHRATAMAQYLLPKTKKDLRSFLGTASYYRRFVRNFAAYSSLLSPFTSKKAPA